MIRVSKFPKRTRDLDEAWALCRDGCAVSMIHRDVGGECYQLRRLIPETQADAEKIAALADDLAGDELLMLGRVQTVCHPGRVAHLIAEGYVCTCEHEAAWTMAPLSVYQIC